MSIYSLKKITATITTKKSIFRIFWLQNSAHRRKWIQVLMNFFACFTIIDGGSKRR